jgi:hypothetical protein
LEYPKRENILPKRPLPYSKVRGLVVNVSEIPEQWLRNSQPPIRAKVTREFESHHAQAMKKMTSNPAQKLNDR